MVEIRGPAEAEDRAKKFIDDRHYKVRQVLFRTVQKEGEVWLLEGEVWFRWAHFFTVKRFFRLKMKPETGDVTSYEETRHPAGSSGGNYDRRFSSFDKALRR